MWQARKQATMEAAPHVLVMNQCLLLKRSFFDVENSIENTWQFLKEQGQNVRAVSISRNACLKSPLAIERLREFGEVAQAFNNLCDIDCSDCCFTNKEIEASRRLFCSKRIQRLFLDNCSLSPAATYHLCELLLDFCTPPLLVLHFVNNPCGDLGGQALAMLIERAYTLQTLKLSNVSDTVVGFYPVIKAISSISCLQSLDLSNNLLCASSSSDQSELNIRCLAESLRHHHQLQYLSLECTGITNSLLLTFLDALGETIFPQLSFLNISGNSLDIEDIWSDLLLWMNSNAPKMSSIKVHDISITNLFLENSDQNSEISRSWHSSVTSSRSMSLV